MSHYRTIEIEGTTYRYVVGKHVTKIDEVGLFDNHTIGHNHYGDQVSVRPSHVEVTIRRHLGIPQREYAWDKPITKKSDPGPRTRGFMALLGKKIVDIRVSAINEVILEDEDACRYAIETDSTGPLGLGVISLRVLAGDENEDN